MTPATWKQRSEKWLPWLTGTVSLLPLFWSHRYFAELWWFGDEWELLDQIAKTGLWTWTIQVFAENFVPLFKLFWGGLALLGGGSYLPMIYLLWLTHAFTVALLTLLLRQVGFGWTGTLLVAGVFGLTATNIETLAWSVQWSAMLSTMFFLLTTKWYLKRRPELQKWNWRAHLVLALFISASALSFSRGVLSGAVLAGMCLLPISEPPAAWRYRFRTAAICVAPAIAVAAVIFIFAAGNHHQVGTNSKSWIGSAVEYGAWHWSLSPLYRLVEPTTWGPRTTLCLGLVKFAIIAGGLRHAKGTQLRLLVGFVLLDLGDAVLLGIGRHHTGLEASHSSRYQYASLICTLPFVACNLEALLGRFTQRIAIGSVAAASLALVFAFVSRSWPGEINNFAAWRGRGARESLILDPKPAPMGAVPGIPFLSTARAKELIARFHLH